MPIILIGILGGTLLAAALKGIFDIGSTIAQNKYNSPRAQRNRLRKAGLPLAYMYKGNVATQSQAPTLSIDPTLGTAQAQSLKQQAPVQKAQSRKTNAEAQGIEQENIILDDYGMANYMGYTGSNRQIKIMAERDQAAAQAWIKHHEMELKKIELDVEKYAFGKNIPQAMKEEALKKAKQQVLNLLDQSGLMNQLKKIRGLDEQLNAALVNDLETMPDWLSSIMKLILIATKRRN